MLAVLALLLVESVSETDPKSTAKQDAKNGNNDAVGLGAAVFRVIKAGTAVGCFVVRHERTRERAHAQQYAVLGIPRQLVRNKCCRGGEVALPCGATQKAENP